MLMESGIYDGTGQGESCAVWSNNAEKSLIACAVDVVNQSQHLCHHHLARIHNFRKKWISLDRRVKDIDLSKSMGNLFKIKGTC